MRVMTTMTTKTDPNSLERECQAPRDETCRPTLAVLILLVIQFKSA